MGAAKRQRLARRLKWLAARRRGGVENQCASELSERRAGAPIGVRLDAAVLRGRIIDESAGGMALAVKPAIGAGVGEVPTQVVRHFPEGVAVKFYRDTTQLDALLGD